MARVLAGAAIGPAMQGFTNALDDKLARASDGWIALRGHASRSEAVRDLFNVQLQPSHRHTRASAAAIGAKKSGAAPPTHLRRRPCR